MPLIIGHALRSPSGDLAATIAAWRTPGAVAAAPLAGALLDDLVAVATQALAGRRPDLVVLATTKGDCARWCDDLFASPPTGSGGPAALAGELGRRLAAPAFAVSAACASGTAALGVAARAIVAGRVRTVVVVGGDRGGAFVAAGFAALGAIDPTGCHPFDAARAGMTLGEVAAAVVVAADAEGTAAAGDDHSHLSGWGAAMDANHLTGPDRAGSGLASACRQALARAGGATPALVIAHGTGTRYNDAAEAKAYAAVCPQAAITAVKGLLGHGLGACGVAEAVLAVTAQRSRRVAGIIGLRTPDADGLRLLAPGDHGIADGPVLAANAGFGGLDAAVVIGATPPAPPRSIAPRLLATARFDHLGWTCQRDGTIDGGPWPQPAVDGELPLLSARAALGVADPGWGRLDLASRLLVALGRRLGTIATQAAVVLASERGSAESDRRFESGRRRGECEPQRFIYTLPTTPIGELSIRCGLHGAGLALLGVDDAQARQVAHDLLADGYPQVVLARVEADQPPHLAWAELWA